MMEAESLYEFLEINYIMTPIFAREDLFARYHKFRSKSKEKLLKDVIKNLTSKLISS
jgi:hypothetical protein